jgi:hypothetical protein
MEEQILHALRQVENSTLIREVCRKLEISEQTFYRKRDTNAGVYGQRDPNACLARWQGRIIGRLGAG